METSPKEKIQSIIEKFGISAEIQSKAMKVSVQTIYNKWNEKVAGHSFNEKNYQDFKNYIISKSLEI